MSIQALGYLGIGTGKLDDWTNYATNWLGMQAVDRGAGVRAFRMDDRKQRLVIDSSMPEGQRYFGWEVADAGALDALAARLEAAGVAVKREPGTLADQRFVSGLISFADPSGNRLEAFHGAQIADEPFRPGRSISGFRTGPLGMGHAVLMVTSIEPALAFYRDLLGFRISDFIRKPITAYFLHANPRHHSVALFEAPHTGMHHLMVELYSFDDVGQGYDIAQGEKDRIVATLGRHPNDLVDVVLHAHAVGHPGGIWLGRCRGGRRDLAAAGDDHRCQLLGPSWPVRRDGARRPAAHGGAGRDTCAAAGDGGQLSPDERRVSVVGRNAALTVGPWGHAPRVIASEAKQTPEGSHPMGIASSLSPRAMTRNPRCRGGSLGLGWL